MAAGVTSRRVGYLRNRLLPPKCILLTGARGPAAGAMGFRDVRSLMVKALNPPCAILVYSMAILEVYATTGNYIYIRLLYYCKIAKLLRGR